MSAIKNISLFIPHVYGNYTSSMIMDVFTSMRIGDVKNVDLVAKMGSDGKQFNAAYIHFYKWHDNVVARRFQDNVLDPKKEAIVMYDEPWFWIVLENKGKKHLPGDRKPRIDIEGFNTPEKPIAPALNISPNKIKKHKSRIKLPKPVNLEAAFEAECANKGFTQEELNLLVEEVEKEENLSVMTSEEYIASLKYTNSMLYSQLIYFRNLYIIEHSKNQSIMETLKQIKNE